MNPDCPECTKDDFCPKHKHEYLQWAYEKARNEYFAALEDYRLELEERIKQNELSSSTTS